jgi:hypothetical protein
MTEVKELLTLAAKACGYITVQYCDHLGWQVVFEDGVSSWWHPGKWDGDCFRMETELYTEITWTDKTVTAEVWGYGLLEAQNSEHFADHNGDKNAARRLASLRVAAELGRRMP